MVGDLYPLAILIGGLALLMVWVIRGRSVYVAAPLAALVVLIGSGSDPLAGMTGTYMGGFAEYMRRFLPVFLLGATFGKLMEDSGGAATLAGQIGQRLGTQRACLAVVIASAFLTYGGVSLFVVGFSVYPLAVRLFRGGNLPRRFIPATIAFGTITFTMTAAGSPAIQNLIPIPFLGTDARAGWSASLPAAVVMFVLGQGYLDWSIRRAVAAGERFEPRVGDVDEAVPAVSVAHQAGANGSPSARPGSIAACLPLMVTILALNLLPRLTRGLGEMWLARSAEGSWLHRVATLLGSVPEDATLAIFLGVVTALVVLRRSLRDPWGSCGAAFTTGLLACAATSSVVGFGAVLQTTAAFPKVVAWVTRLPVEPLVGVALAMGVIVAIAGSASAGQGLALPILKPIYLEALGVPPRALHRVISLASGTFDSLPSNGYIVILIRNICGETHRGAYGPIFVTTVLVPVVGTAVALVLFHVFPAWTAH